MWVTEIGLSLMTFGHLGVLHWQCPVHHIFIMVDRALPIVRQISNEEAGVIECPGRKIWEFKDSYVIVMYRGQHTCQPKKPEISSKQFLKNQWKVIMF